mmetsp:Transcript_58936/g.120660  ORF Transcript_58936/g.120660 Transcript_58936/m.120660 type:complete len:210 (+) Transcript_58936:996-1625(+)
MSSSSAPSATARANTDPRSLPPSSLFTPRATACASPRALDRSSETNRRPCSSSTMKATSLASQAVTSTSPEGSCRYRRVRSRRATWTTTLPSLARTSASSSATSLFPSTIHVIAFASFTECKRRVKISSSSEWQSTSCSASPSKRSCRASASCARPAISQTDSARLACGRCTLSRSTRSNSSLSSQRKHLPLGVSTPPASGTSSSLPPP